jgi:hypothetical protein
VRGKRRTKLTALAATMFAAIALAPGPRADEEASNRAVVVASTYGNCYAKSVPSSAYGNEGETRIYAVEAGADQLVATYDWFATTLHLECNVAGKTGEVGTSVVEFGPWPRGQVANDETLALAFYWNGKLLHRYSTLDIAGRPDNVSMSVSHYSVIQDVAGYQWISGNRYAFAVRTIDGRVLTFDAGTGEKIPPPKPPAR